MTLKNKIQCLNNFQKVLTKNNEKNQQKRSLNKLTTASKVKDSKESK